MTRRFATLPSLGLVLVCCGLLAACHTAAPGRGATVPAGSATPIQSFERQQQERALAFERQNRWPEAAERWAVLALLDPGRYKDRFDTAQARVDTAAEEYLARARQASRKGDVAGAEQLYLASLAMRPDRPEAIEALRAIERARNQREFLRKPGRTLAPHTEASSQRATPAASSDSILELEQASNLATDGDVAGAVDLLEKRLVNAPADEAARRQLADLHLKTGRKLQTVDPAGARAAVARALKVDPKHPGALALARQLAAPRAK